MPEAVVGLAALEVEKMFNGQKRLRKASGKYIPEFAEYPPAYP